MRAGLPLAIRDALHQLAAGKSPRGAAAGRPCIISVTRMVDAPEPSQVFRRGHGHARVFWERATDGLALVAVGTAAECSGRGRARWQQVADGWRRLVADAIVDGDVRYPFAAPLCLGGFAFDDGRAHDADWTAYPDGLLMVPRVLFTRTALGYWVTVNVPVEDGADVASEIAASVQSLSLLIEPGPAPRTVLRLQEPDAAGVLDGTGEHGWKRTVSGIVDDIARGAIEKQVLARRVRAATHEDPADVVDRLRMAFGSSCTVFAVARDEACFVGASPERLVRVDGRTVHADALAGSTRRGASADEDTALGDALRRDPKERHEHALVVRALQSGLAPYCLVVTTSEEPGGVPRLMRMPNVQHLHTPVAGVLRGDSNILELVECLHPTPAVGGVPHSTAVERIRITEDFDRGWYAGPVGWIDAAGGGDFAIAIRSALMTNLSERTDTHDVLLYAGCGIVAGSDPDAEYAESCLKLRPLVWGTRAIGPSIARDDGARELPALRNDTAAG